MIPLSEGLIQKSEMTQKNIFYLLTFQTAGIFGNSSRRESVRLQKDEIKMQHARIIDDLAQRHRREMDTELHIVRRRYMLHEIQLERKQLEEVT